jgi:hypothetical protein
MADRTLTINHADGGSETYTINRDKFAGVRAMQIDGQNVSVDHVAIPKAQEREATFGGSQTITIKRDIEPLLKKVVGGATACYSLRDFNNHTGDSDVLNVRRGSDNAERNVTEREITNGTLLSWVGAGNDAFVTTWYDQSGNNNHAVQLTEGSQPTIVSGGKLETRRRLIHEYSKVLPDAAASPAGLGFTITGLAYDTTEDVLWAVNLGDDIEPVNAVLSPSLVKLSNDGSNKLDEVDLTGVTTNALQGVAYDPTDDTLWVAEGSAFDAVHHINKDGSLITSLTLPSSSGLAYDTSSDTLWTVNFNTLLLKEYNKSGVELNSYAVPFSGPDQLSYNADTDTIWCSGGANGSAGFIRIFDKTTATWSDAYELSEALASEGIAFVGLRLMVADDGYFHVASAANTIQAYNISEIPKIKFDSGDFLEVVFNESLTSDSTQIAVLDYKGKSTAMFVSGRGLSDRRLVFRSNTKPALNAGLSAVASTANNTDITLDLATFASGVGNLHVNSQTVISDASVGSNPMSGIFIGRDFDGAPTFDGDAYELLLYPTDLTASREAVEVNINGYYSIF